MDDKRNDNNPPPPTGQPVMVAAGVAAAQTASTNSSSVQTNRRTPPRPVKPFGVLKQFNAASKNIKKMLTLGSIFLLMVGLSWADGFFTLTMLTNWIPKLVNVGVFKWLIHLGITALSVYLLPFGRNWTKLKEARGKWVVSGEEKDYLKYLAIRKRYITRTLIWTFVVAFNVGASATGIYQRSSGATIDLFGGFTLPDGGTTLRWLAGLIGFGLAFAPEALGRWIEDEWNS